jgi:hypothetical protein
MKNSTLLALALVLGLVATACGGQTAEEQILEQILENSGEGVSDIDLDTDSGDFNMTVEGDDGETINITGQDDDGTFNMTVEGEDGETITIGGGEVPEGMQTPIADGGAVTQTYTTDNERSVALEYPASMFDNLVSLYDGAFGGDDVARSESSYTTDDGTVRSVNWYDSEANTNVTVSDCYSLSSGELDSICVNIYEQDS